MQQIFGGNTYSAANNLYQPNYRIASVKLETPVADVPTYTNILSAASFQSDPPPTFSQADPTLSGGNLTQPASYDASGIESQSLLPSGFLVDWHKVKPLITVSELRHYIKLLAAFDNLLQHVRQTSGTTGTSDERCTAFFASAAYAFDNWASGHRESKSSARPTIRPDALPSLEVLMAWHAYLIKPRWYYEDEVRLGSLGPFPLAMAVCESSCDIDWQKLTMSPRIQAEWIDDDTLEYLPPTGTTRFSNPNDPSRTGRLTKLAQDLAAVATGSMHFLAGTGLLPSTGVWKGEEGAKISKAFVAAIMGPDASTILARPNAVSVVCDRLGGDFSNAFSSRILADVQTRCRKLMNTEQSQHAQRIERLKNAYYQEGSTSVDLPGEMSKQSTFLLKIQSLGWLKSGRFDGEVGRLFPLQKAAIRYRTCSSRHLFLSAEFIGVDAFLHCMTQMEVDTACSSKLQVQALKGNARSRTDPSRKALDIQLAWQLHQLKGQRYV